MKGPEPLKNVLNTNRMFWKINRRFAKINRTITCLNRRYAYNSKQFSKINFSIILNRKNNKYSKIYVLINKTFKKN